MLKSVANCGASGACIAGLILGVIGSGASGAQPPGAAASNEPAGSTSAPASPAPPQTSITPPMTAARVIEVLDQTVDWDRTLGTQQKLANEPSDMIFLYDNRQIASKVVALAFDIGRADADMLARVAPATAAPAKGSDADSSLSLAQVRAALDAQEGTVRGQLDAARQALSTERRSRVLLQAKVNELQGELSLVSTRKNILQTMSSFSTGNTAQGADDLRAQIDAMSVAVSSTSVATTSGPAAAAGTPASAQATPAAAVATGRSGLWDLAAEAFRLSSKARTIRSVGERTAALQKTLAQIRSPLITQIQSLSAQGNALAAQAASADSTTLNDIRDQLDNLASQFKQASAVLLPLGQENLLLDQHRRNLDNWQEAIKVQFRDNLQALAIRSGVLLAVLGLIYLAAELWRRAVLRYIQDTRRRYTLLLLRRIALWFVIAIVVGFAFATELTSFATFAGLITAGIAVAMQSVLVSIVGYFFLIGKYGVRVGDRIQIGEVAGEVIDLGLVRMYLMELGGKGMMGPTGRVVAFANSVVFQVSSGLFKQIAGVNFAWREVVLSLPMGSNYAAIREDLVTAVTAALGDYRAELERQTKEIERTTMSSSAGDARPEVRLQFAASGVEAHVRYPVHREHAAEIDERVTEALAKVMSSVKA